MLTRFRVEFSESTYGQTHLMLMEAGKTLRNSFGNNRNYTLEEEILSSKTGFWGRATFTLKEEGVSTEETV